jgi:cytochrome c oxidase assembly factor CtaG
VTAALAAAPSLPSLLAGPWQPAWPLDVALAVSAAWYAAGAARLARRWPLRRSAAFLAGLAVVAVALQSGVDAYDGRLLSAHMLQHMLLLMPAPLLLLLGRPFDLALRTTSPPARRRLAAFWRRTATLGDARLCLALYSAVVVGTHLPPFYDATLRAPVLHLLDHALVALAGFALWIPLLDLDPAPARRLGGIGRIAYMLATMPAMALVGAYLDRAPDVVYAAYAAPAATLGVAAVTDQQQAGAIMWVGGSSLMVVVGLRAGMRAMVAAERRQRLREARASTATAPVTPGGRAEATG